MGADVDDLIERLGELDPDERRELSSRIRADWARRVGDARRAYLERLEEEPLVGGGGMGFQPVPGEEKSRSSTAVSIRTIRSVRQAHHQPSVTGSTISSRVGVPPASGRRGTSRRRDGGVWRGSDPPRSSRGIRARNRAGVPNRPWVSRRRRVPTRSRSTAIRSRSPRTGGRRPGEPPVAVRFSASLPSSRA